jgi:hypothetical protein
MLLVSHFVNEGTTGTIGEFCLSDVCQWSPVALCSASHYQACMADPVRISLHPHVPGSRYTELWFQAPCGRVSPHETANAWNFRCYFSSVLGSPLLKAMDNL